jgi:hypothetical protein
MTQTQKQTSIILAVIAALALSGFLGYRFYFKSFMEKKLLVYFAKQYNKKCPIYNNGFRTDSVAVQSDNRLEFCNTVLNVEKKKINMDSFTTVTQKNIVDYLKTEASIETMRDNKITLAYLYTDKNGQLLSEIVVKPEMYSKK